jgi:hypothetical protein
MIKLIYDFEDKVFNIHSPKIIFEVDQDATATQLAEDFRSFMLAIGYADVSIGEALDYLKGEYYNES